MGWALHNAAQIKYPCFFLYISEYIFIIIIIVWGWNSEAFLSFSKEQCSDEEEELSRFRLYYPDILQ